MRILAFGDTHGETDFSHLTDLARQADLLVCVGDVTFFGEELDSILEALEEFAVSVDKDIIFVHGNHEEGEKIRSGTRVKYVHKQVHVVNGVAVLGFGGGGFRTKDPEVEAFFSENSPKYADKQQIWLFHGPPHGTGIDEVDFGPTGCMSKRKMMDIHKPALVVAGHIHEQWGTVSEHDGTIVVNPGPFGRMIEL